MSAHENGSRKIPQTHSPLMSAEEQIGQYALAQDCLTYDWRHNSRWNGIERPYTAGDVLGLRRAIHIEHTLARLGAERLWELLQTEPYVNSLGAMTGNQAVQQVQAGLKAIYVSGWQVAADAEAGFGGTLNTFELMKGMIEAGAACVHFEDQLSSAKKCGHLGGKVLVSTTEAVQKLVAARLAADVMGVPTLVMARTDADSAQLLTNDIDARDRAFCIGERTTEGFFRIRGGIESAIARGLAYAPYADLLWWRSE